MEAGNIITSKQFRERIRLQKSKIESIKKSYSIKIDILKRKKKALETKASVASNANFIPGMSNRAEKKLSELETINSQIESLEKEMNEKLEPETNLLNRLETAYNNNRDKLSENDRRYLKNKKDSFIDKIKDHKILTIFICLIVFFVIKETIASIIRENTEKSKDYYVTTSEDSYEFNCNIDKTESDTWLYCSKQTISGTFSNYDTVEFDWGSSYKISDGNFTKTLKTSIPTSYYQTENFDKDSLKKYFETTESITLKNKVLRKTVAEKKIDVKYNLSDSDIELIAQKHDEWIVKKAQEEADKKAAEEKAKAEQEEKAKQEAESQKTEETPTPAPAQEQTTTKQDNGEELPDDISPYDIKALCERGFESLGYTNASISMTNQYPMGYPPYIYVIVGTLSTKAGITSSRQQVGRIQCQANWNTWTIKSLTINGAQVY